MKKMSAKQKIQSLIQRPSTVMAAPQKSFVQFRAHTQKSSLTLEENNDEWMESLMIFYRKKIKQDSWGKSALAF